MFPSLQSVTSSSAGFCTIQDRGDYAASAISTDLLPDFGTLAEGLLEGRRVATQSGWRPVETLKPGDMVLTFDSGMKPLAGCIANRVGSDPRTGQASWGLAVPKGVLGNRRGMTLLPNQLVLLDCTYGETQYGDPFVLVPAVFLDGYQGISRVPLDSDRRSYMLAFDDEEIAHIDGTALLACHTARPGTRRTRGQGLSYPRVTWAESAAFRASLRPSRQDGPAPAFPVGMPHLLMAKTA